MEKTLKMLYNIKPMGDYIMNSDLNRIKKKYGENFAHLCRELFPTILETEGLLPDIIESKFYPNKFLYDDINSYGSKSNFRGYINSLLEIEESEEINTNKNPFELLNEADYILYECKTNDDIQKFKKYYKKEEMLCTFKDANRLKRNYVFFAVKKNVDDIKRENFNHPERQDEYGTSVISLQFTREKPNYLSIKNRYNHTVRNPDATFNNKLDNIILGLTQSFENTYNLSIDNSKSKNFDIPSYVLAKDGKYYKYNYELNNIYYCTDNIIIDNFQVKKYEKERYIIFDYFILDLKEKTIDLYDANLEEAFCKYHKNIEKIEIKNEKDKKYILLKKDDHQIIIVLDNENKMISYYNDLVTNINDNFLCNNKYLKSAYMENINFIGDYFMYDNKGLKEISFPNLESIGNYFMCWNEIVNKVYLPNLNEIGKDFMTRNLSLDNLELPQVVKIGDNFMLENTILSSFYAPYLEKVGNIFLDNNNSLKVLNLPKLKYIGDFFLTKNEVLKELSLPTLEEITKNHLTRNKKLDTLEIAENISNIFIFNCPFKKNFSNQQKQTKKLVLVKN